MERSGVAQGKKVILCVTGGIAAYKVIEVARSLSELGADVRVVMTRSAQRFVEAQTFASLTGNPVGTDLFAAGPDVPHVELARGADLLIIAPATANSLAKLAMGFADDLFSATALTARCPIVAVPAMHTEMWENAATRHNVETLVERGILFVGPVEGALSSGDRGMGRMVEPPDIVTAAVEALSHARELEGRVLLVTAGGTQEPIDPVRYISNRSSGLMGYVIAEEAARRGGKVTLVTGPTTLRTPGVQEIVKVKTAQEMRDAVIARAGTADVVIKAAAVADFRPITSADHKLKKAAGPPDIVLESAPDILAELGASRHLLKPGGVVVGFAAETEPDPGKLGELATGKRTSKGADVIVANDVGSPDSGFEVHTNRAVIAADDGITDVGLVTKKALARALIDKVVTLLDRADH
jgi:phosphopantothenoylcysteine decarboxylase / phosphopantothenate---cysteine ligase